MGLLMDEYKAIILGSLLHDIGKFVQRAFEDYSKKHAEIGKEFLSGEYKKSNIRIKDIFNLSDDEENLILTLVGEHHNDNNHKDLVNIVKLADWLSSGERWDLRDFGIENEGNVSDGDNLLSVFELVYLIPILEENLNFKELIEFIVKEIYAKEGKYKFEELNIGNIKVQNYPNNSYEELLKEFLDELNNTKIDNIEVLLQLLYKYLWCIPSATIWKGKNNKLSGYLPDVSLYDHLKTTCAIAACLYLMYKEGKISSEDIKKYLEYLKEYFKEKNKENKNKESLKNIENILKNTKIFSLIHGDLSGIQDFIFTIKNKYVAKILKGRSFYLDFLMEYLAKYICKELNLPITNIIFCGGGHFYILSYELDDKKIEEFEREINDILFEMFKTKIYVNLVKEDVSLYDFMNFSKVWERVSEKTVEKKLKRFSYKLDEVFEPIDIGSTDRCEICKVELNKDNFGEMIEDKPICKYCSSFRKLTEIIKRWQIEKKANLNEIKDLPIIKEIDNKLKVLSENSGFLTYFLDSYNLPDDNGELKIPFKLIPIAFPLEEKDIKDFNKLAKEAEERTGTNKLAVLKMDVDNLGELFTKGLGSFASISRMSTLSNFLTLFFTGYIPYLIKNRTFKDREENEHNYKDYIYLIYAGGDDTLITGSWDAVWELAKEIRKEFKKFVCYNPFVTVSAGIYLINPKFKFRRAVEFAEEELDRAKDNKIEVIEKNSLSIFSSPMNWDLEVLYIDDAWEKLEKTRDKLRNRVKYNDDKIKILDLYLNFKDYAKEFNEDTLEEEINKLIKDSKRKRIVHIAQIVADHLNNIVDKNNKEVTIHLPYYWRILYYIRRNYNNSERVKFLEDYVKIKVKQMLFKNQLSFNDLKVAAKISELKWRE